MALQQLYFLTVLISSAPEPEPEEKNAPHFRVNKFNSAKIGASTIKKTGENPVFYGDKFHVVKEIVNLYNKHLCIKHLNKTSFAIEFTLLEFMVEKISIYPLAINDGVFIKLQAFEFESFFKDMYVITSKNGACAVFCGDLDSCRKYIKGKHLEVKLYPESIEDYAFNDFDIYTNINSKLVTKQQIETFFSM